MDQAQAYCCLNCTASAGCCVPCNECPTCCADCGDTSSCSASAYFYNGSFYKHFKFIAQQYDDTLFYYYDGNFLNRGYYSSYYNTAINPSCCKEGWRRTYNDRAYFYKDDIRFNCEETTAISDSEACRDAATEIDECPTTTTIPSQCYLGAALYTADDLTPATECFPQFPEFQDKLGTVACTSPNDCYPQVCVIDYPGSCDDDPVCIPFSFPCEEQRKRAYIQFYSKIEFFTPLNLYNFYGQVVGNTIGATYNPCTPTTTWSAPACHFFHP